jgi:spore coat protein A, manganese oxidase
MPLPKGKYDVPLILQDRRFRQDGQLADFDDNGGRSLYGDMIFVNGTPYPKLEVERRKYRFRILNASVSRNYRLALSRIDRNAILDPNGCEDRSGSDGLAYRNYSESGDRLIVIGNDEGLLAKPALIVPPNALSIGIAERYDIIIDFSKYDAGDKVFLRNVGFTGTLDNDARTHTIMRFDVVNGDRDTSEIPEILREVEDIPESQATQVRTFRFERNEGKWKINNRLWDESEKFTIANPKLNAIEIWEFVNPGSGWVHPVHPHLLRFRILDRNGRPPQPYESGPKDVVMVGEFQKVRVLARICPHEGKYMMHCHNLVHEDKAMMTQFEVGKNGLSPHDRPAKPCEEIQSMQPPDPVSGICQPLVIGG